MIISMREKSTTTPRAPESTSFIVDGIFDYVWMVLEEVLKLCLGRECSADVLREEA